MRSRPMRSRRPQGPLPYGILAGVLGFDHMGLLVAVPLTSEDTHTSIVSGQQARGVEADAAVGPCDEHHLTWGRGEGGVRGRWVPCKDQVRWV